MDKQQRWAALLELLGTTDQLGVEQASEHLGVSSATIRRDLDGLAEQKLLTRTRGGARANGVAYELPTRYRTALRDEEKRRIAAAAVRMLPAEGSIGLTGGTTTTEIARALGEREQGRGEPGLTLVTNAVNIAMEALVRPNVKVILTGGVARSQTYELVGPLARPALLTLNLDVAVLGVGALHPTAGASTDNEEEAAVNALLAERAERVMVVADASKLGRRAFVDVCPPDRIWALVTDDSAADADVQPFIDLGVAVVRA
jgi:DeoR family transcriptional regulator, aga operon transcriptional repressor